MFDESLSVGEMDKESENSLLPADGARVVIIFASKGHLEVERSTHCWNN